MRTFSQKRQEREREVKGHQGVREGLLSNGRPIL